MSITTKKINNENVDIVTCDNCYYTSTDIKRFIYFNVIGIYCTDCKTDWIDLVDIYNKKFFSILTSTHNFFIKNSLEYIKSWTNPKQTLIKNLELEIENLQFEINNTEKYHPLFPNRIVICPHPSSQYDTLNDCDLFYMHSGKARKIQGENKENIFNTIKARHRSQNTLNTKFIIEVSQSMLDGMEMGKPIEIEEDLNDSFYILNTYNG